MPSPIRLFDDRSRRTNAGDGFDFQTFVLDALPSDTFAKLLDGRYVQPHFALSKDGAIDHVAYSDDDRIVIECKFVGKDRTNGPRREWGKVVKRLDRNLRKCAGSGNAVIPAIYAPWFDASRPVKEYWFCTSALSPHAGDQDDLRTRIKGFFETLGRSVPLLAHLASVEVRVFAWNDFEQALPLPLRYKWFGGYPSGLAPLEESVDQRTFRRFLSTKSLPYFSRTAFNVESARSSQPCIEDEPSILARTIGDDTLGLLVYGAGGRGKTRLALELARAAGDEWLVLSVAWHARSESVEKLATAYSTPASVLFIIDYAEAAKNLTEFIAALQQANTEGGHNFRFIATCRSSAVRSVQAVLEYIPCEKLDLSRPDQGQYADWAIREILKYGSVPNPQTIAMSCRSMPVLAAWAVYLLELDPERFDAQFAGLTRGDDFTNWAGKRLRVALDANHLQYEYSSRALAEIAISLPMTVAEFDRFRNDGKYVPLLKLLADDHWIEVDEGHREAAHDIFADSIIALYVLGTSPEETATDAAYDVLFTAARYGLLDRAVIALDRLKDRTGFDAIRGAEVVARLFDKEPAAVLDACATIVWRRFVGERGAVTILSELSELRDAVLSDQRCDLPLSLLALDAAKSPDQVWRGKAAAVLYPLLDRAIDRSAQSNIVLSRALVLLPQRYKARALEAITGSPGRKDAHFMLVAWLRAHLPPAEIAVNVEAWLESNATRDDADFVYRSWLNAKGDADAIAGHLYSWLAVHSKRYTATFVYRAWLTSIGSVSRIEPYIAAWLQDHALSEDAKYIYGSWLSAGGSLTAVEEQLTAWFALHGDAEDASHVLTPWLEQADARDEVEPLALRWLESHGLTDGAKYVYRAWLLSSRLPAALKQIEPFLMPWLKKFGDTPSGAFVYHPWLNAGGPLSAIQAHVIKWLKNYSTTYEARYTLSAWLAAGTSRRTAQPFVVSWLAEHGTSDAAKYIYRTWLENGGDLKVVAPFIIAWSDGAGSHLDAGVVYGYCVRGRGADVVVPQVVQWLSQYSTSDYAGQIYRHWLGSLRDIDSIESYVTAWIAAHREDAQASVVYAPWLRYCRDADVFEPDLLAWLDRYGTSEHAGFVYQSWLERGAQQPRVARYFYDWLVLFGMTWEARAVLVAWVHACAGIATVELHVAKWLEQHARFEGAWIVYHAFCRRGGDLRSFSESTWTYFEDRRAGGGDEAAFQRLAVKTGLSVGGVCTIADWCVDLPDATRAIAMLNRLLDFNGRGERKNIISDALLRIIPGATAIPVRDPALRAALLHALGSLAYVARSRPDILTVIDPVHAALVRDLDFYRLRADYEAPAVQSSEVVEHIADLVTRGVLDPEHDAEGLAGVADWLATWPEERKPKFHDAVQTLRERMPHSSLWDIAEPRAPA